MLRSYWGHLHVDLVTDGDADEVFAHFAGNVGKNLVPIGQGHAEHGPRQYLDDSADQLDVFFFRHEKTKPNQAKTGGKIKFFAQAESCFSMIRKESGNCEWLSRKRTVGNSHNSFGGRFRWTARFGGNSSGNRRLAASKRQWTFGLYWIKSPHRL